MSDLQEFVRKQTANLSGVTSRKLYGLDAFYLSNRPFIVITSSEQIAIKVDDFEVKKSILKITNVTKWKLDNKEMDNWFLLPDTFNKKKNKLSPVIEMTSKVLLKPKKEIKKKKKKNNRQKDIKIEKAKTGSNKEGESFFKKLFSLKFLFLALLLTMTTTLKGKEIVCVPDQMDAPFDTIVMKHTKGNKYQASVRLNDEELVSDQVSYVYLRRVQYGRFRNKKKNIVIKSKRLSGSEGKRSLMKVESLKEGEFIGYCKLIP